MISPPLIDLKFYSTYSTSDYLNILENIFAQFRVKNYSQPQGYQNDHVLINVTLIYERAYLLALQFFVLLSGSRVRQAFRS